MEESDEDEPSMGKQVLPVANLPAGFNGEPVDGLQYLFMVRRDARVLPNVTRADNPYEVKEEPRDEEEGLREATNADVLPSEEWRETFLHRFTNFRKNCTQPTIHINIHRSTHKIMPDRKERDHWWAFLSGRPESEWNPPKKPKKQNNRYERYGDINRGMRGFAAEPAIYEQSSSTRVVPGQHYVHRHDEGEVELAVTVNPAESLPTPSGTPAPPDLNTEARLIEDSPSAPISVIVPAPPEPTPTLVRDIDHRYAIHLLMYFAHWIGLHLEADTPQSYVITDTHARWMFVLLSRVDDYISADETSTLRSLARGCIGLIKERTDGSAAATAECSLNEPSKNSEEVIAESSCWIIIAAVIGTWAQKDLWQDAEAMLSQEIA